jgi:hypothetical protein
MKRTLIRSTSTHPGPSRGLGDSSTGLSEPTPERPVVLFEHINFRGTGRAYEPGAYQDSRIIGNVDLPPDLPQNPRPFDKMGGSQSKISSIKVYPGARAEVFKNGTFGSTMRGDATESLVIEDSVSDLRQRSFNDTISSFIVHPPQQASGGDGSGGQGGRQVQTAGFGLDFGNVAMGAGGLVLLAGGIFAFTQSDD